MTVPFPSFNVAFSNTQLERVRLDTIAHRIRDEVREIEEVEMDEGVIEMDVRVRELVMDEKRGWEREEDWIVNAIEEKVMYSQWLIVNRISLISITFFITFSESSPSSPSIRKC